MPAIAGEEKLTSIFGKWPSFHDAEVWSLTHERSQNGFDVVAQIHTFEATLPVDTRGYYTLAKHTLVTLRFRHCEEAHFANFNHQNALFSIAVCEEEEKPDCPFTVLFEPAHGLSGRLKCREIEVENVQLWIPPHGVYAMRCPPCGIKSDSE